VKFRFIEAEKAHFPVSFMCRMLEVSRSGYYASRRRSTSARMKADHALVPLICAEFRKHPRGCGSRPIMHALRADGRPISRRRVVRLMAHEQLRPRLKRRFVRTTDSRHALECAPNVLDRAFDAGEPNRVWASDITYVATKAGWAYLAAVLDIGSRKVVGWDVSTSLEQASALRALESAIRDRQPPAGLIHHSDRGVQYAGDAYQALLVENGMICSMSRKGNCWDNAVVESFFSTLKRELPNDHVPEDWRELEHLVFAYVSAHYNTHRRHSALGYVSPNEYERANAV
jgi:transposase InsO family protein